MTNEDFWQLKPGDYVRLSDSSVRQIKRINQTMPILYFTDGEHCFRQAVIEKV